VADEPGRVSEDLTARRMVPMVMAIDHILDRNLETAGEFRLEPSREISVDRVPRTMPSGVTRNTVRWLLLIAVYTPPLTGSINRRGVVGD
jgi:hypothetical protein